MPVLHRRAAAWYEAHLDPESALFHAHAAGDIDDTARILGSIAQQVHDSGRAAVVEGWLDLFDVDERLDRHPAVAIQGSSILAARGRADEADRWLHAAERGVASRRKGVAAVRPRIAVMRGAVHRRPRRCRRRRRRGLEARLRRPLAPRRPARSGRRRHAARGHGSGDPTLVEAVERAATIGFHGNTCHRTRRALACSRLPEETSARQMLWPRRPSAWSKKGSSRTIRRARSRWPPRLGASSGTASGITPAGR